MARHPNTAWANRHQSATIDNDMLSITILRSAELYLDAHLKPYANWLIE